jgi:hypothetical protein
MIRGRLSTICGDDVFLDPAPILNDVFITDLTGNRHPRQWSGLIDTGADRSCVPLSVCQDLRLAARDFTRVSGFDREAPRRELPRYYVRIGAGGIGDLTILAYGVQRSNVLLGRDFLTGLCLLINDKSAKWALGGPSICTKILAPILSRTLCRKPRVF